MGLVMRNIRSDDPSGIKRADAFLIDNPSPGVRARPKRMVAKAQANGQGLLVTRAEDHSEIACSLIYGYNDGDELHHEIGTMRVTANGLGLQILMARFQLHRLWMENYFDGLPSVFAVVSDGTASAANMRDKLGMTPWQPTPGLEASRKAAGLAFNPTKSTLLAERKCFEEARAALREAMVGERDFLLRNGRLLTIDIEGYTNEELTHAL